MSTLSNALAKSKYTLSTLSPSSRNCRILSWCSRSCERQDLVFLKPCCAGLNFWFTSRWFTKLFLITLSMVFITWEVRDTGRKFAGVDLGPPLWTGITNASFRMVGIEPFSRKFLKRISKGSANDLLHFLIKIEGTPSGPAEEFGLSLSM